MTRRRVPRALRRDRSPKIQAYCARLLCGFLTEPGMPTEVDRLGREHVEPFIADQLDRSTPSTAATRYRCLQQFFPWLLERPGRG